MSGTRKLITLLNTKLLSHCVPSAASAGSRFPLMESMLFSMARSNLLALVTPKVSVHVLLLSCWSPLKLMVQETCFSPSAWVKILLSWIGNPFFVPGLRTSDPSAGEVYIFIFWSIRVQVMNHAAAVVLTSTVPLFLSARLIAGLDHWAIPVPPPGIQLKVGKISRSVPLNNGSHWVQVALV